MAWGGITIKKFEYISTKTCHNNLLCYYTITIVIVVLDKTLNCHVLDMTKTALPYISIMIQLGVINLQNKTRVVTRHFHHKENEENKNKKGKRPPKLIRFHSNL